MAENTATILMTGSSQKQRERRCPNWWQQLSPLRAPVREGTDPLAVNAGWFLFLSKKFSMARGDWNASSQKIVRVITDSRTLSSRKLADGSVRPTLRKTDRLNRESEMTMSR